MLYRLSYSHRSSTIIATEMGSGGSEAELCGWRRPHFSQKREKWGTRKIRNQKSLVASDADVFESHGAQADRIEKILGVDDHWTFQQVLDAIEIEATEFRPAGADNQRIHALRPRRKAFRNSEPCRSIACALREWPLDRTPERVHLWRPDFVPDARTKILRPSWCWA